MLKAVFYINSFNFFKLLARDFINSFNSSNLFLMPLLNFTLTNLFIRLRAIIIKNRELIKGNYRLASYKHNKSCY